MTLYNGDANKTVLKLADALKGIIEIPEWTKFVKSGSGKVRLPEDPEWYIKRVAAILRTVYLRGPIGVSKLRVKFGNKKDRGHKPDKFARAGGKIIRTALQQLEKAGFIEFKVIDAHKGRIVTSKGKSFVDKNTVKWQDLNIQQKNKD